MWKNFERFRRISNFRHPNDFVDLFAAAVFRLSANAKSALYATGRTRENDQHENHTLSLQ